MREVLVTGAAGFVGHHLVAALCARGCRVRVLALPEEDVSSLGPEVAVHRGDVRRRESLDAPMRGADTVFHLAAVHGLWRPREEYRAVNVGGVENVCAAAAAAGVGRLVHVSSWTVYGMGLSGAVREDQPLAPRPDDYAVTKAEADLLVQRRAREGLPAVVVRPGTMFGPGDRVNFGRMADRLRDGKAVLIGRGDNALPFVDVTDVVEGMILAATRDGAAGEAYNLSTDAPITQEQLWRAIAEELGVPPPRLRVPFRALHAAAFVAEQVARIRPGTQPLVTRLGVELFGWENRHAIDKARRELGYAPRVAVREGVRRAAAWYLGAGGRPAARGAA
ncbi:NAD-dependent epimerase/dehydratase family protein [Anaeromyxobacter paludicola]|uniref:Epimerase n=1 Tax=Anaeromyxobacter paludicola TaxID=2918171 RepID=A0ABM7X6G6_9BACT|nr:NAD-dependent epimerase/dehydratase family protein [Anaeromyxobacter paludicola]BDG07430.1 epimerase [Anaeromyxobacter paludicola]